MAQNFTLTLLRAIFQVVPTPDVAGDTLQLQNGTVHLEGLYVKLVWDIADALNLSVDIILEPDLSWITPIQRLVNGEADLGAMPMTQGIFWKGSGLGSSFIFLHAIISERKYLFFHQPFYKKFPSILLRPFDASVWLGIFTILFICMILSILKKKSVGDVFLQSMSLLIGRIYPLTYSPHILPFLLFISFLTNIYTAKVISTFANDDGHLIKTPEDLLTHEYSFSCWSDYKINRIYPASLYSQIASHSITEFLSYSDFVQNVRNLVSPKEKGNFALLDHLTQFYMLGRFPEQGFTEEFCSISAFPSVISYPKSMILRKDSPLREEINLKLIQLNERGFKSRYQSDYINRIQYKCNKMSFDFLQIYNRHVSIAYFILFSGAVTSVVIELLNKIRSF